MRNSAKTRRTTSVFELDFTCSKLKGAPPSNRADAHTHSCTRRGVSFLSCFFIRHEVRGDRMAVAVAGRKMTVTDALRQYADEKIGNSMKVMDILKEISKTKLVVLVTHEVTLIKKYADSYIKLVDGRLDENTDLGEVFEYDTEHNNRQ